MNFQFLFYNYMNLNILNQLNKSTINDLEFIKNDIIYSIKNFYIKYNIDIINNTNLLKYIYKITYRDILTYVKLFLDNSTKINIRHLYNDFNIKNINTFCTILLTGKIYLQIYFHIHLEVNNRMSLSF